MVSSNKMNENTGLNHESIFNYDNNFNITQICSESGGYIAANKNLYSNISNTPTTKLILKEAIKGTSIVKLGSGDLKLIQNFSLLSAEIEIGFSSDVMYAGAFMRC